MNVGMCMSVWRSYGKLYSTNDRVSSEMSADSLRLYVFLKSNSTLELWLTHTHPQSFTSLRLSAGQRVIE